MGDSVDWAFGGERGDVGDRAAVGTVGGASAVLMLKPREVGRVWRSSSRSMSVEKRTCWEEIRRPDSERADTSGGRSICSEWRSSLDMAGSNSAGQGPTISVSRFSFLFSSPILILLVLKGNQLLDYSITMAVVRL